MLTQFLSAASHCALVPIIGIDITRYRALDGLPPLSEAQQRSQYLPSVDTPMMQAMERWTGT
jgi:hypothetical protein